MSLSNVYRKSANDFHILTKNDAITTQFLHNLVTLTQLGLGLGLTTPFNRKLTEFFRTMMYGKNSPRNTGGMFVQFTNILLVLLSMFLHKTETSYKCHLS